MEGGGETFFPKALSHRGCNNLSSFHRFAATFNGYGHEPL